MKKFFAVLCALLLCLSGFSFAEQVDAAAFPESPLRVKDGMLQPILTVSDFRDPAYSNEKSDILRFCVWVETDNDTDFDGLADLVKVFVQLPRAAGENITALEAAAEADPKQWNYAVPNGGEKSYMYAEDYNPLLARGFALVLAAGIGTYGSEGFELCGSPLERDSHKCVVEWLAGDRQAFVSPEDYRLSGSLLSATVSKADDGYDENMPILHLVQKDGSAHLVTAAWTDLQNPGVGSNPSDYVFQETGLEAGVYKDYTFYMMPTVYTLAEGHHLELCLLTWDPYRAFLDENESPEPAEGPKLADYNYSFDIDLDSLKVQLPVVP